MISFKAIFSSRLMSVLFGLDAEQCRAFDVLPSPVALGDADSIQRDKP